jgi:DNA processing protein
MTNQVKYYLALNHIHGIGFAALQKLQSSFATLEEAFSVSENVLQSAGLSAGQAAKLKNFEWSSIEKELEWAEQEAHCIISLEDSQYPVLLRNISSPPIVLFVKGKVEVLHNPQLAIVGTRHPSPIGKENAYQFSHYLASCGLTITSGLALGVDGASHEGALKAGATIAVLGTGIERIYPTRHMDLANRIIESGALVSEFPLGALPQPENFPRRNRIISGLSLGTLVVEAALKSGSLITAHYAMEQGREVFAIPNSIHHTQAKGCHHLIQEGAKLVEKGEDILEELSSLYKVVSDANKIPNRRKEGLDEDHQALLNCIGESATPCDLVMERIDLPYELVSTMLLQLELHGFIEAVGGGYLRLP